MSAAVELTPVASQRATTSSRHPGTVFRGTVHARVLSITLCPDCGLSRRTGDGPHAPHWHQGQVVDCQLRAVSR
jgi:hypothetical protein